jgi:leucyl-tRNA synthetase
VQWTEAGIEGAARFVQRIWKLVGDSIEATAKASPLDGIATDPEVLALRKTIHRASAQIAEEIEGLRFNRGVAQIYELTNALGKFLAAGTATASRADVLRDGIIRLVQMLSPMMPHLAESCWSLLERSGLASDQPWPASDPALLVNDQVVLPVQVNGKRRAELTVPLGTPSEEVERQVLSLEPIIRMLNGQSPKKLIVVPDRIVNVVI